MQYRRLTKGEFDSMVKEFTVFLASHQINKDEWDTLKSDDTDRADKLLDIFSDMIFEKVLSNAQYLERISETEMHLYFFQEKMAHHLGLKIKGESEFNFLDGNLSEVFIALLNDNKLEFWQGTKEYNKLKEQEMFEIMQKGAVLSQGDLYNSLLKLI